jgi:putative heme iron utilization protein
MTRNDYIERKYQEDQLEKVKKRLKEPETMKKMVEMVKKAIKKSKEKIVEEPAWFLVMINPKEFGNINNWGQVTDIEANEDTVLETINHGLNGFDRYGNTKFNCHVQVKEITGSAIQEVKKLLGIPVTSEENVKNEKDEGDGK